MRTQVSSAYVAPTTEHSHVPRSWSWLCAASQHLVTTGAAQACQTQHKNMCRSFTCTTHCVAEDDSHPLHSCWKRTQQQQERPIKTLQLVGLVILCTSWFPEEMSWSSNKIICLLFSHKGIYLRGATTGEFPHVMMPRKTLIPSLKKTG